MGSAEEREGIKELTHGFRERLSRSRRMERSRKLSKEKEKRRALFIKNPYKFTRSLLGDSGTLRSPKEDVEAFLKEMHSNPSNTLPLGAKPENGRAEPPTIMLKTNEPSWKEVQERSPGSGKKGENCFSPRSQWYTRQGVQEVS